jgi:hypothetical protein
MSVNIKTLLSAAVILCFAITAFAQQPGTIKRIQKISGTSGNLSPIDMGKSFGSAVAYLGDINGDGFPEILVGGDQGNNYGSVFIISLKKDGTVKSKVEISKNKGGFTGDIEGQALFGWSVANIGDLDGDGIPEIAVGEIGYSGIGRIWILFLKKDGTVKSNKEIFNQTNGFNYVLRSGDDFGSAIANIGDIDKDGVNDIAVGARSTSGGGAIYIINLKSDGTVKKVTELDNSTKAISGKIVSFGISIASLGDFDHDGLIDIAAGIYGNSTAPNDKGALLILSLSSVGGIVHVREISDVSSNFAGYLDFREEFGYSVTCLGDINGDSMPDIAVGAFGKKYSSTSSSYWGKSYVITLNKDASVKKVVPIDTTEIKLKEGDRFGWSSGVIKDLDGDGVPEYAVGAVNNSDSGEGNGALYICFLNGVAETTAVGRQPVFLTADLYPNPNQGDFILQIPESQLSAQKVEIYDLSGKIVYQRQVPPAAGAGYVKISLNTLPPGMYELVLKNGENEWRQKLVKQ